MSKAESAKSIDTKQQKPAQKISAAFMKSFWLSLVATSTVLFFAFLLLDGSFRASLPELDGSLSVKGLQGPITIARDSHNIPHISAEHDNDLYFAMGYVHAQDRLWQMEMNRRIGHGRLSEIIGEKGVAIDRYMRGLGFSARAEDAYQALPEAMKGLLDHYSRGVNYFLAQNKKPLPPEFLLTNHKMEDWRPVDTLVWQKLMWLDLSGNMRLELARARLLGHFSPEQVASLYPAYPGEEEGSLLPRLSDIYTENPFIDPYEEDAPSDNSAAKSQANTRPTGALKPEALTGADGLLAHFLEPKPEGYGSNNWVVDGTMTKSGKPLLANDPHLGLTTPSIWYLVRLHNTSDGSNIVGVSFPGTPSVVLGRNNHIAWGFTNTDPDVQDLYVEKILDDTHYQSAEGPKAFTARREIIRVRGAKDIEITIRETDHGPLISDAQALGVKGKNLLKPGYGLALSWPALNREDPGALAILGLGKAKDFNDFREAGRLYYGPEQNMIYADTTGNIGYRAPALIPLRHNDNPVKGRYPSPGWDKRYDWSKTYLAFEALPEAFNPENHLIATANEKIIGTTIDANYRPYLTRDWSLPYRANRIRHLLGANAPHDLESFQKIQGDITSDMARDLLPILKKALTADPDYLAQNNQAAAAFALIKTWDARMASDRPEALIFQNWLKFYYNHLVKDELGPLFDNEKRPKVRLVQSSLFWSLQENTQQEITKDRADAYYSLPLLPRETSLFWCDNQDSPETETCLEQAQKAFTESLDDLEAAYGPLSEGKADGKSNWTWGAAHPLEQTHRPFGQIPVLSDIFSSKGPQAGAQYTINVAGLSHGDKSRYRSTFGPSYRGIFDLSDLDRSLYIQPTGQSGHFLSSHYGDLFPLWQEVRAVTIKTDKPVPDDKTHLLTLYPE